MGRFYDTHGRDTALLHVIEGKAEEVTMHKAQEEQNKGKANHIPCNVSWNKVSGGTVWCPDKKHPRKIMIPDSTGTLKQRCACFEEKDVSASRVMYEGCEAEADTCKTTSPDDLKLTP